MIDLICNLFIITFETLCCKLFVDTFFDKKQVGKPYPFLLLVLCNIIYTMLDFLQEHIIIKQVLVLATLTVCISVYVMEKIKKVFVCSALFYSILMGVDFITYIVYRSMFKGESILHSNQLLESLILIVCGKLLLFVCVIFIRRKIWRKNKNMISELEWVKFMFFPIFTLVSILAMFLNFGTEFTERQIMVLSIIGFGLVIMNFFIYSIIEDIIEREETIREGERFDIQRKEQSARYADIAENYEIQRNQAHEYANHIFCIKNLMLNHEYEKVNDYLEKIGENIQHTHQLFNTNHVVINAILNAKYQEAIEKGIQFTFKINDLSKLSMEDEDLVVILSNLLNNAIEASEKCKKDRKIKLKLVLEEDDLIISVKNNYQGKLLYHQNKFFTTKDIDKERHGIGITNIIHAVEKNGGYYNINLEKNMFYFAIVIPR